MQKFHNSWIPINDLQLDYSHYDPYYNWNSVIILITFIISHEKTNLIVLQLFQQSKIIVGQGFIHFLIFPRES